MTDQPEDRPVGLGGPDDPLRLDRQLCFPLYAASNLITRLYRPVLAEIGLTYPQYLVMLVMWEGEPLSVGALCSRLHLDTGTMTPLLKRMESAGVITRQRDVKDERRVVVALTSAGLALKHAAAKVPLTLGAGLNLSPESLMALRDSVQEMVSVLAQSEARATFP